MKLTDSRCRTCKPTDKVQKLADGGGLYLEVTPAGGKIWRQKYRYDGKEKRLTHGQYPLVSLAEAREKRDAAKKLLLTDVDPGEAKKDAKIQRQIKAATTFELVAREWHEHKKPEWTEKYSDTIINRLEVDVFPVIGNIPIEDMKPYILLQMLKDVEARGVYETTRRINQYCSQIFRYAVVTGRMERDITGDIRGALKTRKVKHHAAIDPLELPEFLKTLERNEARMYKPTRLAVQLMMLTFVRTGELINMRWKEIDWDAKRWVVPAERMKMGKAHIVPLSRQALAILEELKTYNGFREWVFASHTFPRQPMSNNTILAALNRMGYKGRMTGHGFRALALTTLQERLGYPFEIADVQLAHAKKHSLGEAYDRAQFLEQRTKMMQDWADYLDRAAVEEKVKGKFQTNS